MKTRITRLEREHVRNNIIILVLDLQNHNRRDLKIEIENFMVSNLDAKKQIKKITQIKKSIQSKATIIKKHIFENIRKLHEKIFISNKITREEKKRWNLREQHRANHKQVICSSCKVKNRYRKVVIDSAT